MVREGKGNDWVVGGRTVVVGECRNKQRGRAGGVKGGARENEAAGRARAGLACG